MMQFHFNRPWRSETRKHNVEICYDDQISNLIERLLSNQSEKQVSLTGYGRNMRNLDFAPNSPELAAALHFKLQSALQDELGNLFTLKGLQISSDKTGLRVLVQYIVRHSGALKTTLFERAF